MRNVCCLAVAVGFALAASASLVGPDGRDYSKIVIAPDAPDSVRLAASELRQFLGQAGIADLPVCTDVADGEAAVVLGGDAEAEKLDADGFVIRTAPGRLVIAGKDSRRPFSDFAEILGPFHRAQLCNERLKLSALLSQGTLCGVYAFLEDCCGVRFYMPGEDGTVVPRREEVKLPELAVVRTPRFGYRNPWYCNFPKDEAGALWYHRAGFGGRAPVVIIHSFHLMKAFQKEHPEFFALADGGRDFDNTCAVGGGGHLCLNAPGLIEAWAAKIRQFFDAYPDMEVYPVAPNDGLTRVCGCPACQAEVRPEAGKGGKFSYHIWKFVDALAREVAKTHPDRFVGCLAYEEFHRPPEGLSFSPNTAVMICGWRAEMSNDAAFEAFWKAADGWAKKVGRVYFWSWYLTHWPPTDRLPAFYPKAIVRSIARMAETPACKGEFIESENYGTMFPFGTDRMGTPGMTHLNLYLTGKLLWNPQLDVRATLDEYYRLFYGPAEKPMRAFWEEAADSFETAIATRAKASPDEMFPRKTLLSLGRHLDEAAKAAPPGSAYARRIALIDGEFRIGAGRLTRMQSAGTPVLEARPVDGAEAVATLKPMRFFASDAGLGEPPTWVFCGYDRRNVYLKFLCYEPRMANVCARYDRHDDERMWDDDCIELFFCPDVNDLKRGYQFIVNVAGATWDARKLPTNAVAADASWESGAKTTVRREENRWTVEIAVPLASLGVDDVNFAGDMLVNFYRTRNADKAGELFAWSPNDVPQHFNPAKFGRLKFVKGK